MNALRAKRCSRATERHSSTAFTVNVILFRTETGNADTRIDCTGTSCARDFVNARCAQRSLRR
eukprot:3790760-Prymnesium_polylepis.1